MKDRVYNGWLQQLYIRLQKSSPFGYFDANLKSVAVAEQDIPES